MLDMFNIGLFFLFINMGFGQKEYHREYYPDGGLKAQGWEEYGLREDYWEFYFPSGQLKETGHFQKGNKSGYWHFYDGYGHLEREGHYMNGKRAQWWIFYDEKERVDHKCQFHNGVKNGYCLKYKNGALESAVKFHNGTPFKEWHDLKSFKKDNNF